MTLHYRALRLSLFFGKGFTMYFIICPIGLGLSFTVL